MQVEFIIRIIISGILGCLIGLERERRYKEAGLRTHFLVAIGSSIIMIISKYAFNDVLNGDSTVLDPSRIAAQVVSGIGFLGAGTILVQRQSVRGLTTAAGLWATSGIGLSIGAGMYIVGIVGACLVLIGLELLTHLFQRILPNKSYQLMVQTNSDDISTIIELLTESNLTISQYQVKIKQSETKPQYRIDFKLKLEKGKVNENTITSKLQKLNGISSIEFINS
ncbi:MgtC/SapB family protein [Pullulanibacillus sp. KACC 23026]|uniref:MgtC/SapB family protein n=1 Tax=Pullulanibacillus sp. KACC 23026 TaxID=3028315 RepID=UPI0023B08AD3|nr:MgtC/SapB family protein [Pullulanibacillus sp. KACC 23026]WEG13243.1 MgtC/SapB family protein [Pullulanibacillus sp. KACC 23026]